MENELYHFGIKGMKWGVRRFQNPDGSLTPAGKARYGSSYNTIGEVRDARRSERRISKAVRTGDVSKLSDVELKKATERVNAELSYKKMMDQLNPKKQSRAKKIVAEIAENAVKDLGRRMFTLIGDKIFSKPDTTTSEYSPKDLDKLTDKQLQDFQKRQQAKSGILGIQKKIDAQKLEPSMKKLKDEVREAKVESKLTFREVEKVDKIIKGMSDVKTWSLSDSEESRGKSFIEENWSKSIDELYDLDHSAFVDAFLAHHGIKGQKWGVKHGPPYPLDDAVSTGKSLKKKEQKTFKSWRDKASNKGAEGTNKLRKLRDGWDPSEEAVEFKGDLDEFERSIDEWSKGHKEQVEDAIEFWIDISQNVYDQDYGKPIKPELAKILANNGTMDDVASYALKYYGFDDTPDNRKFIKPLFKF